MTNSAFVRTFCVLPATEQPYNLCSNFNNFNYKPQAESQQQHLGLYVDHHQLSVAIMIEVTSRHLECTYFNLDYSQMHVVAQQ